MNYPETKLLIIFSTLDLTASHLSMNMHVSPEVAESEVWLTWYVYGATIGLVVLAVIS